MEYDLFETDWGFFGMVASEGELVGSWLPCDRLTLARTIFDRWPESSQKVGLLAGLRRRIIQYFQGKPVSFDDVKVRLAGMPPFRQRVLKACRGVGYGETESYGELAARLGVSRAARAVGGAMAANPLPLIIPCHRILRSDGQLGGFSSPGGVLQKKRMLEVEASAKLSHAPCRHRKKVG